MVVVDVVGAVVVTVDGAALSVDVTVVDGVAVDVVVDVVVSVFGVSTGTATTVVDATAGLVVYDLRTALRRLDDEAPTKRKKKSTDA